MANKNFEIKNGLTVAGTERISSAGLLTGTTTTQAASDNTTKLASTAYVTTALANLVDGAPSTLNTLNEIAAALNDDAALNTTLTTSIAAKLPLAGGTLSGNLVMGDNNITGINKLEILDSADNNRLEIYGNASNSFIFDMGGTGSVGTINFNDFKLGIGTPSPAEKLQVKGAIAFEPSNSTNRWSAYTYTDNTFRLNYNGAGADELILDTSGRIHLNKASTNSDVEYLRMEMPSWSQSTSKLKSLVWHDSSNNVAAIGTEFDGSKINLHFHSQYNGGYKDTSVKTMSILGNGNVGIGTEVAAKRLQIYDATQTNQSIQFGPHGTAYGEINYNSTGLEHLYIDSHGTTTGYGNIVFRTGPTPSEVFKLNADGMAEFTSGRSEYAMSLTSAGTRSGLVLNKPGTTTVMGSVLMLSNESFRLGTASHYHIRMEQTGNTYMGNSGDTRFGSTGNLSVNTTTMNSGITSGTDVRALGPCFANDANSFTMSQEGTGNTDAYLAARGANGSTRGNIRIGVSVSGGGNFKTGLRIDTEGRSTTPENPAFRARATSAQSLASSWRVVGYDTLIESRGTGYSTSNSRFTAPVAGWYQFNASWSANGNSDADGTFSICINGSTSDLVGSVSMPDTSGNYDGHSISGCCYLDVNDYVDVRRYSTVSTTTRSSNPYGGWFSGFLIG